MEATLKTILRLGPLVLVPLAGLALLNCGEREPTQPEVQPVTTIVRTSEAAAGATVPRLTAAELLQDPALGEFLGALTIPNRAEKMRRAMDAIVADLEGGDAASAQDHFDDARKAVANYGKRGELDPDDDIHLDVIDLFLDGVEELLPEVN
jgi:hypothetical protein